MNEHFYDMYQKAQSDPSWFLYVAKASETNLVDKEELNAALSIMGQASIIKNLNVLYWKYSRLDLWRTNFKTRR